MTRRFITREAGQGKSLVLMHGLMGKCENWEGVLGYLPPNCRGIALHFPFFSEGLRLDSIETITDYARRFLDERGIERTFLGGNSLGGHIALHLALEMPQRIQGLVLTGSSGLFERTVTGPRGANPSRQWVRDKMCEIFYEAELVTEELVDDVCAVIAHRRSTRDLVRIAKSAKRDNLADRLGEIQCPALLIWGRQDEITPPHAAREFNELLPQSRLEWIDRCGHAPMMERPYEFAEILGRWWSRVSGIQLAPRSPGRTPSIEPGVAQR